LTIRKSEKELMSYGKRMVVGKDVKSFIGDLRKNSLRQKPHIKRLMVSGQQKAKPAALITDDYGSSLRFRYALLSLSKHCPYSRTTSPLQQNDELAGSRARFKASTKILRTRVETNAVLDLIGRMQRVVPV
jgi:hypothetical protein